MSECGVVAVAVFCICFVLLPVRLVVFWHSLFAHAHQVPTDTFPTAVHQIDDDDDDDKIFRKMLCKIMSANKI